MRIKMHIALSLPLHVKLPLLSLHKLQQKQLHSIKDIINIYTYASSSRIVVLLSTWG